jgi:hypothetical protein
LMPARRCRDNFNYWINCSGGVQRHRGGCGVS